MPKQVRLPSDGERTQQLHVTVPADLKAEIVAALPDGTSLNQWVLNALWNELRFGGTPRPIPAPVPSVADVLASYVSGDRLLGPCGNRWPCAGDSARRQVGVRSFCDECGVCIA